MKTLIILAVILGVIFLFFGAKAEKSLVITGNEAVPAGIIGTPKALFDKVGELTSGVLTDIGIGNLVNLEPISTNNIVSGAKNFISDAVNKIGETIKTPIEDKIKDFLCPQK